MYVYICICKYTTKETQKHINYYKHPSKKYKQVTESKNNVVKQILQTISYNYAGPSTTTQEGFQGVENRNIEKGKIDNNANKIK